MPHNLCSISDAIVDSMRQCITNCRFVVFDSLEKSRISMLDVNEAEALKRIVAVVKGMKTSVLDSVAVTKTIDIMYSLYSHSVYGVHLSEDVTEFNYSLQLLESLEQTLKTAGGNTEVTLAMLMVSLRNEE